jgi:geranylgeranyl diphosphate synthase type II
MDIKAYIREKGELINSFLGSYFERPISSVPSMLHESMLYSLLAGGKRIRPVLAMASCEACGGKPGDIVQPAAALEVIHTYSLIHDDLPAMDNDDLRRGKPTNHKVFGEAVAILAGDGLLSEAFLMILEAGGIKAERLLEAARELSLASGARGMVGGQVQDILSEGSEPDKETLHYIHTHKTGTLLRASVRFGGILVGADREVLQALSAFGESLGLAFQIVDDILDIKGDESLLGKPVGSDLQNNKMTYPAIYGLEASRAKAGELISDAIEALKTFSREADPLRGIANYILQRQN